MGKLQTFFVELENPSAVYFTSQMINGRVLLVLTEPMKMRGIRLNLCGKAYTHWTESHSYTTTDSKGHSTTHSRTESYSDWEYYINTEVTLWGKPQGSSGDTPIMAPGSYQLPFSFTLPPNCPSSFEGTWGYIRYFCKAIIDKPWKFDHTTKRPFTVISLVDLNFFNNVSMPTSDERIKTLGCGCCKSGVINCSINVPRTGFVPGEIMPIEMQVVNNSRTKVDNVSVSIEEHVDFYARGHCRSSTRTVAQTKKGNVEAGKTLVWKNEGMRLPPMAPTLVNCRIMKINYFLHFNVDPSGTHTDLDLRVPIVIGNVPLRVVMQELHNLYERSNSYNPATPGVLNPSAPPLPLVQGTYPDLPPPSYEETVFGQTNIKDADDNDYTMGQMAFAPRYPYYDWSQLTNVNPSAPPQSTNYAETSLKKF